jgi:hypothetical protein
MHTPEEPGVPVALVVETVCELVEVTITTTGVERDENGPKKILEPEDIPPGSVNWANPILGGVVARRTV